MGYSVDWTLTAPPTFLATNALDAKAQEAVDQLKALGYEVDLKRARPDDLEWNDRGFTFHGWQWYRLRESENQFSTGDGKINADDHFTALSELVDGVFTLDAVGEDGEVWRTYIRDGRRYTVKPCWPDFDPEKLGRPVSEESAS